MAATASGVVLAGLLAPAADAAKGPKQRPQVVQRQLQTKAALRAGTVAAEPGEPGEDEDEREGLSEEAQAAQFFGARRTAPAQTVSGAARLAAQRQAAKLPVIGPKWAEVTNKPYDADDPNYRDPNTSNSGGGAGLVSGRASSIALDGRYAYLGSAGGGVWRSTNGGKTWAPVFDGASSLSIGAIAVNPADHSVWVGTGEHIFGDAWASTGVYRSADHGKTFQRVGGAELYAKQASRIAFDGNGYALVSTMDGLYRHSARSVKGAWQTVLKPTTNPTSGSYIYRLSQFTDVVVRPGTKGRTVFAPLGLIVGSPNNGIYVSTKGGVAGSFKRVTLKGDLESDEVGRTSFSYDKTGKRLYAVVQSPEKLFEPGEGHSSELAGVFVSAKGDPAGPWKRIADAATLAASGSALDYPSGYEPGVQADYNEFIQVDPADAKHVYLGLEEVYETRDGGATWKTIGPYWNFPFSCWETNPDSCPKTTHADQHGAAVGGGYVWVANDGGVYKRAVSKPKGWIDLNATLHTLQYYKAAAARAPGGLAYWGGLQDNGVSLLRPGAKKLVSPFGGDGGDLIVDPGNADRVVNEYVYMTMYLTTNGGRSTGLTPSYRNISPACFGGILPEATCDPAPLFIAPLGQDVNDPEHWVAGGHYVWEDTKGWDTTCTPTACDWKNVHDLGSSALGVPHSATAVAMNGSTIYAAWCGGCNLTTAFESGIDTNYGGTWHRVTAPLPPRFITGLSVDPADPAHVLAAFGGYYTNWIPSAGVGHLFESYDGGTTWTNITGNLPDIPAGGVTFTPQGQIVLATDLGVYVTDQPAKGTAGRWARFGTGLPNAPVVDVRVTPLGTNVLVATHGRGLWQLPLRPRPPAVKK